MGPMTAKLTASLRRAPVTVPCLAAIALFVVWAADQAGYPVTHWAPGGLIVLGLLVVALATVRVPLARLPRPTLIALGCLAAYTALSYFSIIWANSPGDAWEGADRTLLYLLVFALFALWPQRGPTAAALLLLWTLALTALGLFALLHVDAASASGLRSMLAGGRLQYPTGYPNANAAQWLMAAWPALLMARERGLPWALRGVLAGSAVLLAEVALLSQSRGSLYATPVMLVLVFALLPGRTRTFAVLVPVAIGVAATARPVLHVGDRMSAGAVVPATLHHAVGDALLAAVVVALVVAAGAAVESRRRMPAAAGVRLHRATGAVALAVLAIAVAGGLVAAGNPVHRVERAWHSFKGGYSEAKGGDRLLSGLGSNRYDFYRVALDEFRAHPLAGIGVDNFQQQYLRRGRSPETPRYPHSVELRTLSQTGLLGALLAVVGLGGALLAGAAAVRRGKGLGPGVAAAALAGFAYWLVHGSVDWFWEFAGLGAPAFALLGLACSLAPLRTAPGEASEATVAGTEAPVRGGGSRRTALRAGLLACAAVLAVAVVLAFAAPWISRLELQNAARVWPGEPARAYARLEDAAGLEPLGDSAYSVAGSIALRRGEIARADRFFARALARVPDDAYATLERGAIASEAGRRAQALALLSRAWSLNPRDPLTTEALQTVRRGRRVSVAALNRAILQKAQELS